MPILTRILPSLLVTLMVQPRAMDEARRLIENGRPLEALHVLDEARRADPEDAAIQNELGALYAALGRTGEALEALGRAAELAPDDPSYALAYGEALYRSGQAEAALPFLQKASAGSSAEASLLIAGAYESLGNEASSLEALSDYVSARPDEVEVRILLGEKLEKMKRLDDALRAYQEGLDGTREHDALLYQRMAELASRERDRQADAESFARLALERDPQMLEARLALARALERTGRAAESLAELERAREEHPDSAEVHYNLIQAYQRAGRAEEAQAASARFLELSQKKQEAEERQARVAATYKRAVEILHSGNMLAAEPVFRSVLEIDPDNPQARSMLAKIAFSKNDVAAARRWIEEAIDEDDTVAEYHYLRGLFEARAGNGAAAEPHVRRSLELEPGFPEAWSLLGTILLDTRRAEESVVCFERAASLDPQNAAVQLNLASAYASLGRDTEEARAMERYRELIRE